MRVAPAGAADASVVRAATFGADYGPRHEAYGVVAAFEDLCCNRWDPIQRKSPHGGKTSV